MEFEAIEPAHRTFANGRHIFENPVSFDTLVFANSHFGGINKGDTRALAETNQFQKEGKGNYDFSLKLNKSIVRE
jgi:predicted HAD superfamily phosphohydrolase